MDLICKPPVIDAKNVHLRITGSKSETNRLLILKALYPNLTIENASDSDDSRYLAKVLESKDATLDIGHAGTAMRFGTAYFATQEGIEITLTGSDRMKERPIGILVNALNSLGASVHYEGETGFPPLKIIGKKIAGGDLAIDASVSSQFLTALLLVAPSFENGLVLRLKGTLTSRPYLEMTVSMLAQMGVSTRWEIDTHATTEIITVKPSKTLQAQKATVESDWSSAGYWYSWTALQQPGFEMKLSHYNEKSLQGDSKLAIIFKDLGVQTQFLDGCIKLTKVNIPKPPTVALDLTQEPDQAQTIFATCLGLGIDVHLTGLHTLKIKETDRIEAMKVVGLRFRESEIITTDSSITLKVDRTSALLENVVVDTFHDHRMAMAFAPLSYLTSVIIKDAGVVSKSYGTYWDDLRKLNIAINEI